jgi:hypothetical protein
MRFTPYQSKFMDGDRTHPPREPRALPLSRGEPNFSNQIIYIILIFNFLQSNSR